MQNDIKVLPYKIVYRASKPRNSLRVKVMALVLTKLKETAENDLRREFNMRSSALLPRSLIKRCARAVDESRKRDF